MAYDWTGKGGSISSTPSLKSGSGGGFTWIGVQNNPANKPKAVAAPKIQTKPKSNPLKSIGAFATTLGKNIAEPFVETGKAANKNVIQPIINPKKGPGVKNIMDAQKNAQKANLGKKLEDQIAQLTVQDRLKAMKMATDKNKTQTFVEQQLKKTQASNKKEAGAALSIASMGVGGLGLNQAIKAGGKAVAKNLTAEALAGGAGGLGGQLSSNPNSSVKDLIKATAIGTGVGVVLPVAGKALGLGTKAAIKGAGKVAEPALTKTGEAVAPYINPIDRAVVSGAKAVGRGSKAAVEALPGGKAVTNTLGKANARFQRSLVDSYHPVLSAVRKAEDKGTVAKGSVNLLDKLRGDVTGSGRMAQKYLDTSEPFQNLVGQVRQLAPNNKTAVKDFGDYAQAIREVQLMKQGKKIDNPERLAHFTEVAHNLHAKYGAKIEKARQHNVDTNTELTQMLKGNGLSEANLQHYLDTDPEYIRTQRIIDEERKANKFAKTGGGTGNAAAEKVNKFATQEAHNPLHTTVDRAYQVHSFLTSNALKKETVRLAKEAGLDVKGLRTTEKVVTRNEIRQGLKASKALVKELSKLTSEHKQAIKDVTKEIANLQKRGAEKVVSKKEDIKNYLIKRQTGENVANASEVPSTGGTGAPTARLAGNGNKLVTKIDNPEELLNEYINSEKGGFRDIIDRMAEKDRHVADLRSDLETIASRLGDLKDKRLQDYLKARGLSDNQAHGSPTISFWDNGVRNTYKVPSDIAGAINHYNAIQTNGFFNAIKNMNNVFKYGTTQGNPAFAIPNWIRDQWGSAIQSESVARTHNPVAVFRSLTTAIGEASGNKTLQKLTKDKMWDEFSRSIGSNNFVDVNKNLKKAAAIVNDQVNTGRNPATKLINIKPSSVKAPFNKSDELINSLENATRFQNYKGTYKLYKSKGYSDTAAKQAAVLAARRNSVDFSAAGDTGRFLNSITPYLNAAIQGTRTLGRTVRERPATATAKILVASSPAVAATYWNLSDAQRAKVYASVPQYVKDANIVIVVGKNAYTIPLPQEIRGVSSVMRTMGESQFGYDPRTFMKQGTEFIKSFSPVSTESPLAAIGSFLPAPLKAGLELGTNKSFYTGQEIVPQYIKDQNPNPADQKYATGTSGTAQRIARGLGVSPLQVEYFGKQSAGETGLGGPVSLNAADVLTGQDQGGRTLGQSLSRRFEYQGSDAVKSDFNKIYYPLKDSTDNRRKQIYGMVKDGNVNGAKRKADEYNALIDRSFSSYYRQHGQFADPEYAQRIGALKIEIAKSKKGKSYVKF